MTATRVNQGVTRPAPTIIYVGGEPVEAFEGESLAAALLAHGYRSLRSGPSGDVRGPFCNMGVCFECVLTVDGQPNVRACMSIVRPGMRVEFTGKRGAGSDAAD